MSAQPSVLVVDDDPAIRDALDRALRLEGFGVSTRPDGPAALATVEEHPPDVMVLDVMMPGLSGVEVVRRLRADGYDLPICVLSARDELADRVEGLRAGADDYLVKPFELEELVAAYTRCFAAAPTDRRCLSRSATCASTRPAGSSSSATV